MHVPWGWIRQRPHFIAEGLSEKNTVSVVTEKSYRKKILVDNQTHINLSEVFRLPIKRNSALDFINVYIVSWRLNKICKEKGINIIWVTDIRLYSYLRGVKKNDVEIVYDCMDETLEFPAISNDIKLKQQLKKDELELIKEARHIFCSSQTLKDRVILRTKVFDTKITVVHNALNIYSKTESCSSVAPDVENNLSKVKNSGYHVLTYVGTISEWLDVECLIDSLESNSKIVYFLIGPLEIAFPEHERLIHIKPVEHNLVDSILLKSDVLIMPFKINKLIESVDPVKLYEYIRSAKPVIASNYPELKRFSDHVYLYNTTAEYIKIVDDIINGNAINKQIDINQFVEKNTWACRINQIQSQLDLL